MASAQDDSFETLGRLLDAYRPFLMMMARKKLGPALQARLRPSDLVQDTLHDALAGFRLFEPRGEGAWTGWLLKLLDARLIDARRREFAQKRDARRDRELRPAEHDAALLREIRRRGGGDSTAERREDRQRLLAALERLPADYQQVIRAHHEQGRTYAEIGRTMGRSEEAVRKLWERALKQLHAGLKSPNDHE